MNLKPFIVAGLIALAVASCAADEPKGHLVSEVYTVKSGDTLWNIGEKFIVKNTGGRRYLPEFISGLEQLNWDLLKDRQRGELHPGDKLTINYFVKED